MILAKLTCEDCQRSSAAVYEVKDYKPSSEIFPIKSFAHHYQGGLLFLICEGVPRNIRE